MINIHEVLETNDMIEKENLEQERQSRKSLVFQS